MESDDPDPSRAFLERLMASIRHGHRLDDPRNPEVLQRWFLICRDLPDGALSLVIPATLRGLLRQPEIRERLREACGVSDVLHLQHEAIAPYLISYRRYMTARTREKGPLNDESRLTIAKLRGELNALREEFNTVFDQATTVEIERERLSTENDSLQQQLLTERLRIEEVEKRLTDAKDRAARQFRLYLYLLKEEHERRTNDPDRQRLLAAEMAVETHALTLESLGESEKVTEEARTILGDALYEDYFENEQRHRAMAESDDLPPYPTESAESNKAAPNP